MSIFTDLQLGFFFCPIESRNENESESDSKNIDIDFHAKTLKRESQGAENITWV